MLGGQSQKTFGPPSNLFCQSSSNEIILSVNDRIVSDQTEVCNIFNNYFVNVAKDIGNDSLQFKDDFSDHPSIQKILENNPVKDPLDKFSFKPVEEMQVHKIISKLDIKKSTGVDNIYAKILKSCVSAVSGVISNLINTTYSLCKFPTGQIGVRLWITTSVLLRF